MNDYDFSGKTVLVTGGSMGIGEAFARRLASLGAHLVLVARGEERLLALAAELAPTPVHTIACDLSEPGAARRVFEEATRDGRTVDVLVNNAGFAAYGPFEAVSLEVQRGQIDVNVGALVELTHLFLPHLERQQGGVIHVASTAAFQPVPYMAVYGATKAFVLSFSEALWAEYRSRGVRVVALCPGATDTPFFARAGEAAAFGTKARAEDVVELGLRAFRRNRASVIHGAGNRLTAMLSRLVSREVTAKISARLMAPAARLGAAKTGGALGGDATPRGTGDRSRAPVVP